MTLARMPGAMMATECTPKKTINPAINNDTMRLDGWQLLRTAESSR
jgi:hypothetical protein